MRIFITFIFYNIYILCNAQYSNFNISAGIGISGINQLIKNNVEFYGKLKFNQKLNELDNKYRNNTLHSGFLSVSKKMTGGFLHRCELNLTFSVYSFGSTYFKEDKLTVTFGKNDTINTPNWIISKYRPSYLEFGISRSIIIGNLISINPGVFFSYMVELYGTSKLSLVDSIYGLQDNQIFYFNKEFPNKEYDQINYGIRCSMSLLPNKVLQPIIIYTQSLNDLSKENIYINQHANLWSLQLGLKISFKAKKNKTRNNLK